MTWRKCVSVVLGLVWDAVCRRHRSARSNVWNPPCGSRGLLELRPFELPVGGTRQRHPDEPIQLHRVPRRSTPRLARAPAALFPHLIVSSRFFASAAHAVSPYLSTILLRYSLAPAGLPLVM